VKIKKNKWALAILLIISFFVRIYKIDNLSLFGDEIDVGYQAFSLLNSARDYKGNLFPTYIQSLSESRAPLLIYLTIPGIKIFGLNELGVRITPIVFGLLSIYLFYKLIFFLSRSNKLALCGAIALSVTPWHFHYSRSSFEVTLLISLILFGVYYSYKFIDNNKNKYLYLSIFFFCLSFYTYNTANIFVPLLIIFIFLSNFKYFKSKINHKNIFISLLIFLLLTTPILFKILFGSAANRFGLISIFNNQQITNEIINKRTIFSAHPSLFVERLFHNKPISWTSEFIKNYLSSFSIPFLFLYGDQTNLRHSVPGFGLFFVTFIPFLFYGLIKSDYQEKQNKLMIFWLFFSPIASSLTVGGYSHPTRLFLMIIPLSYFSAFGFQKIVNNKNIFSNILIISTISLLIFELVSYSHEYFVHYPKDSFENWNYGYKELFGSIPKTNKNIFISNTKYNSLLPFVFYQKYYINNEYLSDKEIGNIYKNFSGFKLNSNVFFINDFKDNDKLSIINNISNSGEIFVLFQKNDIPGDMDFTKNPLSQFRTIKTVYNPNKTILGQIIQKI